MEKLLIPGIQKMRRGSSVQPLLLILDRTGEVEHAEGCEKGKIPPGLVTAGNQKINQFQLPEKGRLVGFKLFPKCVGFMKMIIENAKDLLEPDKSMSDSGTVKRVDEARRMIQGDPSLSEYLS